MPQLEVSLEFFLVIWMTPCLAETSVPSFSLELHFIKVGHKELRAAQIDANALVGEVI